MGYRILEPLLLNPACGWGGVGPKALFSFGFPLVEGMNTIEQLLPAALRREQKWKSGHISPRLFQTTSSVIYLGDLETPRKPKKISSGCCKSPRSGCGTKAFTSSASSSPCALNGGCHDDQNWILLASQKCQVYQNYMHHPKRDGHPVFASEWKTAFVVAPLFQYGVWVGAIAVKLQ